MPRTDRADLLPDALRAAARFRVLPLAPSSKMPAIDNWPRRATRDRRVIRRWWRARPDSNIGICTGSGLLVVDLDVAEHGTTAAVGSAAGGAEPAGLQQWRRLLDEHDEQGFWGPSGLPRTYTVETASKGWHVYLRTSDPPSCRNTQQMLGPRIDTRGAGGYVVAAGSRTADGAVYRILVHRPIATAPQWLVDALRPRQEPAPPRPRVELVGADSLRRYVRRAIHDECETVAAATTGGRNAALLRAARIVGEFVGAGALSEQQATAALLAASDRHIGVDGFTAQEAVRTIASGLGYGCHNPRDLGRFPP